ncbi:MAG: iron-containing alcohol dehydrogenase [Candidatus Hodarchaeales archaeon]|jgi:glycerol-1-phosphate dehydrogenase [NAD(P)+]
MPGSEILESIVPRSIIIGNSILDKIPQIIESLRFKPKVMVLSGTKTRYIVGEEVYSILEQNGIPFDTLIVEEASLEAAITYQDRVKNTGSNIMICAGGGKVIDIGKYCSFKANHKTELISVPTTTSHDGIASPFIFLNDPTEKYIGESRPPVAIIADIDKIVQHPDLPRYLAAGVGDTVGKMTAIWDWRYAHRIKSVKFSRFVGGVLQSADSLFQNQVSEALVDQEKAVKVVLKALLIAGVLMGTSNDIRVGYGSEHLFSQALHSETPGIDILHGERVALGTILMAKLQGQDYEQIIKILEAAGCPTCLDELEDEIDPEAIINALQRAHKVDSIYTILGETGLSQKAAKTLAIQTNVIS